MGDGGELRDKAAACLALAGHTADPDIAKQFMQLAFAYERLADWESRCAMIENRLRAKLSELGASLEAVSVSHPN